MSDDQGDLFATLGAEFGKPCTFIKYRLSGMLYGTHPKTDREKPLLDRCRDVLRPQGLVPLSETSPPMQQISTKIAATELELRRLRAAETVLTDQSLLDMVMEAAAAQTHNEAAVKKYRVWIVWQHRSGSKSPSVEYAFHVSAARLQETRLGGAHITFAHGMWWRVLLAKMRRR